MPQRKRKSQVGRRTGIQVQKDRVEVDEDGLEDPETFFDKVVPGAKKPAPARKKKKIEFSMDSNTEHVYPGEEVRPRHLMDRKSIDTADLSTVAAASPKGIDPPDTPTDREAVDPPEDSVREPHANDNEDGGEVGDSTHETHSETGNDVNDMIPPSPPENYDDNDNELQEETNEDVPEENEPEEEVEEPDQEIAENAEKPNKGGPEVALSADRADLGAGGEGHLADEEAGFDEDDEDNGPGFEMNGESDDERKLPAVRSPARKPTSARKLPRGRSSGEESDESTSQAQKPHATHVNGSDEESVPEEASAEARKKKAKDHRKKGTKDFSNDEDSGNEELVTPKEAKKSRAKKGNKKKFNPYASVFSPKGIAQQREYTIIPISHLKADPPTDPSLRRSSRVRVKPLRHWAGERQVYGPNDFGDEYDGVRNMSVVTGIEKPEPTPYKKPNRNTSKPIKKSKAARTGGDAPFDLSAVRKQYSINDGKYAELWDERHQEVRATKVLSYLEEQEFRKLPVPRSRTKKEGKVAGLAAQSFNVRNIKSQGLPSHITGSLKLPPAAIKDSEPVGSCFQIFTVVDCQPKSLELAYGDPDDESGRWDPVSAQRFYLSQGDNFTIPQGNSYRLENRSTFREAIMSWSIIRPLDQDDDEEE